ncbi:MAG: 3Fe-4S ferredoxin [Marmoricola sp.]|jgi:ferredoxin|nr:3Fe-4S ferredoxin [Marmoricola sp.]MCW2821219.1 3Fe-4S ferredoxin [Marmoricola sp.]MCW2827709.1 3Fe-4S ferredoxin [Marmoricola sp.]
MRIEVDRTRCAALGVCESIAPSVFEVNDDHTMVVREPDRSVPAGELHEDVEDAVASCPTSALRLLED